MRNISIVLTAMIAIVLLCGQSVQAQGQVNIAQLFSDYQKKHLTEKVFLHIDKNIYLSGEILWYKAYCVDDTENKLLDISKVVYVELLNENREPVLQAKVELMNGVGAGSFYLPGIIKGGGYQLRAYTNWMKNFDPQGYFTRNITIINTLRAEDILSAVADPAKQEYTASLYPEGGNLVRGLDSKLAFQVYDAFGKGVDCEVEVVNLTNQKVASGQSRKFGMGSFLFKPENIGPYRAHFKLPGGGSLTKELPRIFDSGYVLRVEDESPEVLRLIVSGTGRSGELQLLANQGGRIVDYKVFNLKDGKAEVLFKKGSLPDGVIRFTLFDNTSTPQCERLVFISGKNKLTPHLISDKPTYALRSKVSLALTVSDVEGEAIPANASMAVFRLDSLDRGDGSSIVSYLTLSSELKGNIESPEYYISSGDIQSIDNLMLTHGWRRFKWEDVVQKKETNAVFLPEYLGHIVTANIVDVRNNKPASGISTYLSVPSKVPKLFIAESSLAGKLTFHTQGIHGPGEVLVQNNYAIDSTYRIDVLSPFSTSYSTFPLPKFRIEPRFSDHLNVRHVNMQATNIFKGNKLNSYKPVFLDSNAFYGAPTKKYMLDEYVRFTTMTEVITEFIAEVQVQRANGRSKLNVFDVEKHQRFNGDPLILLDGLPVFNDEKILEFDPLKVRSIETASKKYSIGSGYFDGIVNFTTYKGDMQGFQVDPKATVMNYEGLQFQREFYKPRYSTDLEKASSLPDLRDLLHWEPFVQLDNGKSTVEFFTSDQPGKYIVVVNGLTKDGRPFYKTQQFNISADSL